MDLSAKAEVEEAKVLEWETLVDKGVVIILTGLQARQARLEHSCRILKSRFVLTREPDRYKARWCLRGYLDPDTIKLVSSGKTSSPTISQIGRTLALQMIASRGFDPQIGDVRRAFIEATDE